MRSPTRLAATLAGAAIASTPLLAGCNDASNELATLAERTRTATEQLATRSEQRNEARELQAVPYVDEIRRPAQSLLVERFETREGPDGYFVYDTQTHSIASIGGRAQAGLSYEQARAAYEALDTADEKGALP